MDQPEIKFIKKLIRMRRIAERLGSNRKPGVMGVVEWLDIHIKANGYTKPNESRMFLLRHHDKVSFILFGDKPKLEMELNDLLKPIPV
jgi:hypothetical protein